MKYLIIGGTGTLGQAVTSLLYKPENQITIYSRGELEQQKVAAKFPHCHYVIGDIRDKEALRSLIPGHDVVFNFAALKHVNVCENHPEEAMKTNFIGTKNVAELCREFRAHMAFSSTDKAVLPINNYGFTKALAENYLLTKHTSTSTVFRWGNVVGSRGSVVPIFVRAIKQGNPLNLTHSDMTRYWIRIEDAAKFMLERLASRLEDNGPKREVQIPFMKAARVMDVANAIAIILDEDPPTFRHIGIQKGEKLHECLYTSHTYCRNSNDPEAQYTMEELIKLLEPTVRRIADEPA